MLGPSWDTGDEMAVNFRMVDDGPERRKPLTESVGCGRLDLVGSS